MRNQKGITLIALVVTIIVLLILAAVSITALTDEDKGVVTKAKQSAQKTEDAAEQEDSDIKGILDYADEALAGFTVVFLLVAGGTAYYTKSYVTKLDSLPTPSKTGYKFTGWYYDSACTNKANEGDTITADTTLYAGWTKNAEEIISNSITTISKCCSTQYHAQIGSNLEVAKYTTSKTISSCEIAVSEDIWEGTEKEIKPEYFSFEIADNIVQLNLSSYPDGLITSISDGAQNVAYIKFKIIYTDGTYDIDEFYLTMEYACMLEGTQISLADGTKKNIENITYEDELLVWDFDNGCLASSKPLWIQKKQVAGEYNLLKFENGSELKTVNQHRIFNKDAGKFTYPMTDETPVGTVTVTSDGTETKLVSKEKVQETVNYYNIITDYHMNLFAEDILTSCRLSNLYEIKDMKYVKDNRELALREEYPNIPEEYFKGLRIAEQPREINRGNDVKFDDTLEGYVQRLINLKK